MSFAVSTKPKFGCILTSRFWSLNGVDQYADVEAKLMYV
jgi:hypothetical protein